MTCLVLVDVERVCQSLVELFDVCEVCNLLSDASIVGKLGLELQFLLLFHASFRRACSSLMKWLCYYDCCYVRTYVLCEMKKISSGVTNGRGPKASLSLMHVYRTLFLRLVAEIEA